MSWSYKKFSSEEISWQKKIKDWESHTVPLIKARLLVDGYIKLIKKLNIWVNKADIKILDIGAGGGYIGQAFFEKGFSVLCTEHTKNGVNFIKKHNPNISTRLLDISNTKSYINSTYDLILCRELYPFTRVNCFEGQIEALENISTLLKDGGTLLLIGSTVSYPHCADYKLLLNELNKKSEYKYLYSYAEMLVSRKYFIFFGSFFIRFLTYFIAPILKSTTNMSNIKIYVLHKNKN